VTEPASAKNTSLCQLPPILAQRQLACHTTGQNLSTPKGESLPPLPALRFLALVTCSAVLIRMTIAAPRPTTSEGNAKISRQRIPFLDAVTIDRGQQRGFLSFSRRFNALLWVRTLLANISDITEAFNTPSPQHIALSKKLDVSDHPFAHLAFCSFLPPIKIFITVASVRHSTPQSLRRPSSSRPAFDCFQLSTTDRVRNVLNLQR
jgi:hypothetical protein